MDYNTLKTTDKARLLQITMAQVAPRATMIITENDMRSVQPKTTSTKQNVFMIDRISPATRLGIPIRYRIMKLTYRLTLKIWG